MNRNAHDYFCLYPEILLTLRCCTFGFNICMWIMNIQEIAKIIDADVRQDAPAVQIDTLLTDSRTFRAGPASLFFALSTPSGDGHNFIPALYSRGVRNFVVSDMPAGDFPDADFLKVASPLKALQQLGAACRRNSGATVVGITGSKGKTIVKEWLNAALEPADGIVRSPRSFNSRIGVPLSLAAIKENTSTAIIEAGISRTGEMSVLADIIAPDIAVFTNIADDHADGFASMRQKAMEKSLLAETARLVVFNADTPLYAEAFARFEDSKQLFGWSRTNPEAPLYISGVDTDSNSETLISYRYMGCAESAVIPFSAPEDIENAITVIATLLALGLEPARIACGLRRLPRIGTRIDVSDGVNDCLIAYDSFTADISSLEPALDFMHRRIASAADHRAPTLILSDLHTPVGVDKKAIYTEAGRLVKAAGVEKFIGIGPELAANAAAFPQDALFFPSTAHLMEHMSTSDFNREFILLKGAPEYGFTQLRQNLEARTHETVLEVNLDAIVRNFNYFRSHLPASTGLIAMVKASGYGAGSLEIAKTLQSQGAAYLAVAVLDEGLELRRAGITMPIMVMNPKVLNYRAMFAGHLEPEIYGFDMLADVIREAGKCGIKGYPIHIKLDTGMHRMGFKAEDLPRLISTLRQTDAVRAATLFSHLATADCPDMNDYSELQLSRFEEYTSLIMQGLPYPVKRHVLNSAGILRFSDRHYDFARLGIGLYGVNTLPPDMEAPLSVVSTLRTVVIAVQECKAGETVGYARRGQLLRDSRIATIPIGYADGMNRKFGNGRSSVIINGHECPTVGNICMDACMIDVTDVPCSPGDSVEIFGNNMPVDRLADILETIPYEVLTSVSPRVKRVYYRE